VPELFPIMRICAAALSDIAGAALAGVLFNRIWLGGMENCNRQLRTAQRVFSAVLLLDVPLQFVLLSASMTGDSSWTDAWHALPDVATTHSGRALTLSFCFVPFLLLLSFFSTAFEKTKGIVTGMALVAGLFACRALSGHAASGGDFTLREVMQFLHLTSIAAWGGGILIAGLIVVPHLAFTLGSAGIIQFGRRLSQTVTFALAAVVFSGIYNSWKGLDGSLSPLPHSEWGRMLLMKLLFVLLAFGHGLRVRLLLGTRTPWTPNRTGTMRQWMRAEAFCMVLVFIFSAWLANLPPADM